jgi:energy-coupling factor transporter ATP-binding protein EcfA2
LKAYPKNQWVIGGYKRTKDAPTIIENWHSFLYANLIEPSLNRHTFQNTIYNFFKPLLKIDIKIDSLICSIKPLGNISADADKIFSNFACKLPTERQCQPDKVDVSNTKYLPVRDGIIEFNHESYRFRKDNYDILIPGCSNIMYDPNYFESLKRSAFLQSYRQKALHIVTTIYPEESEREYMLTLYSSILNGEISKDMFIELYGSGGDGKSTICNLIMGMLGSNDTGTNIELRHEDGTKESMHNPCGLATNMTSQTILCSVTNTHNEGGLINLPGKRFCSVAEPNKEISKGKLNCSIIKELTGGTTMQARGIYKASISFNPNALMVLQTNTTLGYSEDDTDAMRRRMAVIPHRGKFYNSITEERLKNVKYSCSADPTLVDMVKSDPYLWQAFFFILLPYALKINKSVSNIKMPEFFKEATEQSFNDASNINGFFNNCIEKRFNKVISFKELIDKIIDEHKATKDEGGLLSGTINRCLRKEATLKIFNKFTGYIYKLRTNKIQLPGSEELVEVSADLLNGLENDIHDYFNISALNNETNLNVSMVYIVDHILKDKNNNSQN